MELALGFWLLTSLLSQTAPSIPINLEWNAPEACPESAYFFEHVEAHLQNISDSSTVSVAITIKQESQGFVLRLSQDGNERRILDPSCRSLIEAAGLIVGLWLRARPPPRSNPIRADLSGDLSSNAAARDLFLIGVSGGGQWPNLLGSSRPQFELYFGRHFGVVQVDLGFKQSWPSDSQFEQAPSVSVRSFASLGFARLGYTFWHYWQPFMRAAIGVVSAQSFAVENARRATAQLGMASAGVRFSEVFTDTWRIFAQVEATVLFLRPTFTISNLGTVLTLPSNLGSAKIGLEYHFQ